MIAGQLTSSRDTGPEGVTVTNYSSDARGWLSGGMVYRMKQRRIEPLELGASAYLALATEPLAVRNESFGKMAKRLCGGVCGALQLSTAKSINQRLPCARHGSGWSSIISSVAIAAWFRVFMNRCLLIHP